MTHYFIDKRSLPDGAHEGDFGHFLEAMMETSKTCWDTSGCGECMPEPANSQELNSWG